MARKTRKKTQEQIRHPAGSGRNKLREHRQALITAAAAGQIDITAKETAA